MRRKWFLAIGVVIIIFFSVKHFNDFREKDLDDVIHYDISNVESFSISGLTGKYEWRTDQKAHAEELKDFLSNYRVKRMKDHEWDSDVSKEDGFTLAIYSKDKEIPIEASIYEKRLLFYNEGEYYQVVNDRIDVDWIRNYSKENKL